MVAVFLAIRRVHRRVHGLRGQRLSIAGKLKESAFYKLSLFAEPGGKRNVTDKVELRRGDWKLRNTLSLQRANR